MSPFEEDLEFIQSLLNPKYLEFLNKKSYFKDLKFIEYLKFLTYFKKTPYCLYLTYPECLTLLDTLIEFQEIPEFYVENLNEELENSWRLS